MLNIFRKIWVLFAFTTITLAPNAPALAIDEAILDNNDGHVIDVSSAEAINNLSEEDRALYEAILKQAGDSLPQREIIGQCFDYYTFNSVQVIAGPALPSTVPGASLLFSGVIKNDNPYPLVDAQVYAKIFKVEANAEEATLNNGFPIVDFIKITDNLTLKAGVEQPFEFGLDIPQYYAGGDYKIAFFVTVADRFNLLGLSFTDDIVGNTSDFSVVSDIQALPTFQKDSVTLNQEEYHFAAFPPHFTKDENVELSAVIENPLDKTIEATIVYEVYNWDGLREENKVTEHAEKITLAPKEKKTVTHTIQPAGKPVTYVLATLNYKDTRSIINPRFVRDGLSDIRINFPGVTEYPLRANQENTLFSCLHAVSDSDDSGSFTLNVTTPEGETIHSYNYEGTITSAMMGVDDTFTPDRDYADFDIRAVLRNANGEEVESVTLSYRCADINPELCETVVPPSPDPGNSWPWLKIISSVILLILILLIGWIFWRRRNYQAPMAILILLTLFTSSAGTVLARPYYLTQGHAFTINPHQQTTTNKSTMLSASSPMTALGTLSGSGTLYHSFNANVVYRTDSSVPEGDISQGTTIDIAHPRENTDISWFFSGSYHDSPYGCWADKSENCPQVPIYYLLELVANLPQPQVTGEGAISCDGNECTATGVGAGTIKISYPQNSVQLQVPGPISVYETKTISAPPASTCYDPWGKGGCTITAEQQALIDQWNAQLEALKSEGWTCYDPNGKGGGSTWTCYRQASKDITLILSKQSLPATSLTFTYNVGADTTPPNKPTMTCPDAVTVDSEAEFTFQATDPDGDNIKYQVDWDNNGTPDENVPISGYLPSGTAQTKQKTFTSLGSYTIKARTVDEKGAYSEWDSCPVEVKSNPPNMDDASVVSGSFGDLCTVGGDITISMKATDPDDDDLRYLVDWGDGNDYTDYVSSGTLVEISHTFSSPVVGTIKVFAEDIYDNLSPVAEQINVSCIDDETDDSGSLDSLDLKASPQFVRRDEKVKLEWSYRNANNCSITGPNTSPDINLENVSFDYPTDGSLVEGSVEILVGPGVSTFTLSCSSGSTTESVSAKVRQIGISQES